MDDDKVENVTLMLPYTDPIDWDRFQEKVRAALADCSRMASAADLRRRPRFEVVLKPVGVPTPTAAVGTGFQPDRTSTPLLSEDSKEGGDGTAAAAENNSQSTPFLAAVTALRKQNATWRRKSSPPAAPTVLKKPPLEYSDAPIPALVVHVSSVDSFYIHRYEDQERLRDLGLAIGRAQKHRLSSVPSAGTVVLANFQSGDGLWYRAEVLSSNDVKGEARVRFVDYGNKDTVDVSHMAEMPGELWECPQMAYRCALAKSPVAGREREAADAFWEMFRRLSPNCLVQVVLYDHVDARHVVDVAMPPSPNTVIEGDYAIDALEFLGVLGFVRTDSPAKKISTRAKNRDIGAEARPIEVGSSLRAAVSHCDGPDCFYMQKLDAVGEIQRFQDDMQTYYKKHSGNLRAGVFRPGMIVATEFEEDGNIYRARVTRVYDMDKAGTLPQMIRVHFVDYGNSASVTWDRVYKLPDAFLEHPPLAMQCALSLPSCKVERFPPEVGSLFREITTQNSPVLTVTVAVTVPYVVYGSRAYIVDLADGEGDSVNVQIEKEMTKYNGAWQNSSLGERLAELRLEESESAKIPPEMRKWPSPVFDVAESKSKFTATVMYLDDEGQIYLQTEKQMAAMFKMGKLMRAFYKDTTAEEEEGARIKNWRKGEIGIGHYYDNESFEGRWFRFQVVLAGELLSVFSVDFGDLHEAVDPKSARFRRTMPAFGVLETPVQCLRCKLDNVLPVGGSYKDEFLSAASDSIVGRKVEVTVTRRVDKFPLPVIVHLIEEDQNRNKKRTNVARMFKQMGGCEIMTKETRKLWDDPEVEARQERSANFIQLGKQ